MHYICDEHFVMHYICDEHFAMLGATEHVTNPAGEPIPPLEPETKACCYCPQPRSNQRNVYTWATKRAQLSCDAKCPAHRMARSA